MNLILENSACMEYHTYFGKLFESVPELSSYSYLISGLDTNGSTDERLRSDVVVLSGEELAAIVREHDVQFIWAVLSAFREIPKALPLELPFADGNPNFWRGSPRPQLPGATFEIVCFDSGCTLFIGVDAGLAANLKSVYPDIRDLDERNRHRASSFESDATRPTRASN
jgi:hypothetical protein